MRSGPQDLPSSWTLTFLLLAVYLGQSIIAAENLGRPDAGSSTFVAAGIQVAVVYVILTVQNRRTRLPQTLLALAATGIPIGLAMFALLSQASPDENQPGLFLLLLALIIWSVAVESHIYRCAFAVTLSIGVLITVLIFSLTYIVNYFLFL